MISETNDISEDVDAPAARNHDGEEIAGARQEGAPVFGALPAELVFTERAAAALRTYLAANGLGHYRVFFASDDVYDVEQHLDALGEVAAWEAPAPMVAGGETIHCVTHRDSKVGEMWESGILRLSRAEVVIGRWYWVHREYYSYAASLWLCAAPSAEHYAKLRSALIRHRRTAGGAVWQVVRGYASGDDPRPPRDASAADELLLTPALRKRLESEVINFFDDSVAQLYRAMKVPYRRGVLLHGPPGNGKTSIIRYVGAKLLSVPAMLLRPAQDFDTDNLEDIVRRWKDQAPAILAIEDLDWLLEKVNVSTFLNLLDGVDTREVGGGLMLIATTNNPEKLDPAVNNRPGRFDVVIEVDRPNRAVRLALFRRKLADLPAATLDKLADATDRLSFAHLLEVLRLSGFAAIAEGREARSEADLLRAAGTVRRASDEASRGFPQKFDVPLGLGHLHRRSDGNGDDTGQT